MATETIIGDGGSEFVEGIPTGVGDGGTSI